MMHCGLASVHKSSVHHALYGVVCTEARPACTSFIGSQKRPEMARINLVPRALISYCACTRLGEE